MCGIAGFIGRGNVAHNFLSSAKEDLKHRGPDGSGTLNVGWAGLSHVRLALISPGENGAQPLSGKRFAISFNGEIYNWQELANDLEKIGNCQNTSSDTEVLLHCIEEWGILKTLGKLKGIFSFIVVDLLSKKVSLVRDSAGTKPLYYFKKNGIFYFSSEIKAFRNFGLKISEHGLQEYMTFQNFVGEETIFEHVNLVKPGCIYEFRIDSSDPDVYIWDPGYFRDDLEISNQDAITELERLLRNSVQRNLISDFPVGAYLSGGIDSSTLAILLNEINEKTNYFTIGFDVNHASILEKNFDERTQAERFAKIYRLKQHVVEISPGEMEKSFDELCWAIEEPRVGQSYPNLYAAKLARKHAKAVISGAGGDELFGGYPWRYEETLQNSKFGKNVQLDIYFNVWHRLGNPLEISRLLGTDFSQHKNFGRDKMKEILELNSTSSTKYNLSDLLFFEYRTFLHGLLVIEDKISMSSSLEIRVPYLDQDLVNFAKRLPNKFRIITNNLSKTVNENDISAIPKSANTGKILLRELSSTLRNPLSQAPKKGFSGPDATWFRHQSLKFVKSRLFNANSVIWDYLDRKEGIYLIESHINEKENRRLLLWSLLSLESLMRQFL